MCWCLDLCQGKVQGCITGIGSFANIVSPLAFSPLTGNHTETIAEYTKMTNNSESNIFFLSALALFLSDNAPFHFPGFSIMCAGLVSVSNSPQKYLIMYITKVIILIV